MSEIQTTEAEKVVKPAEEQKDELVSRKEILEHFRRRCSTECIRHRRR